MPSLNTQPARGMRDFLPSDVRKRNHVIGVIKEVYERFGFEPLETPAAENIETLLGKYGEEGNQLIFKILKRGVHESTGEADLALRYDLTVPLARVVAEYRDKLPRFFKRYQIQPVWRADRPAKGRFREFYQCDVDVLGSRSLVVEAEICAAAGAALTRLGFRDFIIKLNHRGVLSGVLHAAGIAADKHDAALVALDKLDKVGAEGVAREFVAREIDTAAGARLLNFFVELNSLSEASELADVGDGSSSNEVLNAAVLGRLVEFIGGNEIGASGIDDLRQILKHGAANGVASRIKIDPSLARGLSYYTGSIFEIAVPDLAGSLGGGGRYDDLVGMFSKQSIPACGFSLGLERIIVVMNERQMFPADSVAAPADVMVAVWNEETMDQSLSLATELRAQDLRVDLFPEPDKLGKQFKYASAKGIPFVVFVGEDEAGRGEVAIKDLSTADQRSVKREAVASALKEMTAGEGEEA